MNPTTQRIISQAIIHFICLSWFIKCAQTQSQVPYHWGPWSPNSRCSRSCGLGVVSRQRLCYSYRDITPKVASFRHCVGKRREHITCKIQECPSNLPDFRSQQCSKFNHRTYRGRKYHWNPFRTGTNKHKTWCRHDDGRLLHQNPCQLICVAEERPKLVIKQSSLVIDGTSCSRRNDLQEKICVSGECVSVGCDHQLNSIAKEDRCGVCQGNNNTCKIAQGKVERQIGDGHAHLLSIPIKSRNIYIREIYSTSRTVLVLKGSSDELIINASLEQQLSNKNKYAAGTMFIFNNQDGAQTIQAKGPLAEDISISAWTDQHGRIEMQYLYILPSSHDKLLATTAEQEPVVQEMPQVKSLFPGINKLLTRNTSTPIHLKRHSMTDQMPNKREKSFQRLNTNAGKRHKILPGLKIRYKTQPVGVHSLPAIIPPTEKVERKHISNQKLINFAKPAAVKRLKQDKNDQVKASEGRELPGNMLERMDFHNIGFSSSQPFSMQKKTDSDSTLTGLPQPVAEFSSATFRRGFQASSPDRSQQSRYGSNRYYWKTNKLAPCSVSCNDGVQTAYSQCYRYDGKLVDDNYCDSSRKPSPENVLCTGKPCPPRWVTGSWGSCSLSCGQGQQTRTIRCWKMMAPGYDSTVHDYMCDQQRKPIAVKSCTGDQCSPTWRPSEWGECSVPCGYGTQTRTIQCSSSTQSCDVSNRPVLKQRCIIEECKNRWTVTDWSKCSGSRCGQGFKKRDAMCRNAKSIIVDDKECDITSRPLSVSACSAYTTSCPATWVPQEWGACSASCGMGTMSRQITCGEVVNDEFIIRPESRCSNQQRPVHIGSCRAQPCSTRWFTTPWSQCTVTCGTNGVKSRDVKCYADDHEVTGCDENVRPKSRERCVLPECPTQDICNDDPSINCQGVTRAQLCHHWYYRKACCSSCER